jgi:hypothetical protein
MDHDRPSLISSLAPTNQWVEPIVSLTDQPMLLPDPAAGALLLALRAGGAEGVEDLLEAVGGARQHDGAAGAGSAELLLGHVEQLAEGVAAEVVDGDEEPPPVPGVGGEVAPRARCRARRGDLAAAAVPLSRDLGRQLQWAHHDRSVEMFLQWCVCLAAGLNVHYSALFLCRCVW